MRPPVRLERWSQIQQGIRLVWQASPRWATTHVLVLLAQGFLPLVFLLLIKRVIDDLTQGTDEVSTRFLRLLPILLATGLVAILESAARSVAVLTSETESDLVADEVARLLHEKSIAVELGYYERPEFFDTLHHAQQDSAARATHLVASFTRLTRSGFSLGVLLVLLVSIHWLVAAVLLVSSIPGVLVRARFGDQLYRWRLRRTSLERETEYLNELLTRPESAQEVRLFDLGPKLIERFREKRKVLRRERLRLTRQRTLIEIGAQSCAEIAVFATLALIAFQTISGQLTLGSLVVFLWAYQAGRWQLQEVLGGLLSLYEDSLYLSQFERFLRFENQLAASSRPRPVIGPPSRGISLQNVSFTYPGSDLPALQDVSLTIHPGEKLALVGANGSGKSTLVKLLVRLYDPTSGTIYWDGSPLTELDPDQLRSAISVVCQDFLRLESTVRDNILFGAGDSPADRAKILAAVRQTRAEATIGKLPVGLDTWLGKRFEGGFELSQGEWQKLALARAVVRESPVLILDEPTSALDAAAEQEVFRLFHQLADGRTAILISHRLSTVKMADRIIVLEHGRIVETGTHDELINRRDRYARMFEVQAQPYR